MDRERLSQLKRELKTKLTELEKILEPAFESSPVFPGVVTTSKHRCGNPGCACTREGKLHEAVRVLIKFKDGYATRSLDEEQLASFEPRTDAYRSLRKARGSLAGRKSKGASSHHVCGRKSALRSCGESASGSCGRMLR